MHIADALDETESGGDELMRGYMPWDWLRAMVREILGDLLASQGRSAEARELLMAARGFWADPLAAKRAAEIDNKIALLPP